MEYKWDFNQVYFGDFGYEQLAKYCKLQNCRREGEMICLQVIFSDRLGDSYVYRELYSRVQEKVAKSAKVGPNLAIHADARPQSRPSFTTFL